MVIHKLTYNGATTIIQEPIGFDNLKTKISRSDYHGISLEVSVSDLEFYGEAYNIIKDAYEADIESKVEYSAESDGVVMYYGIIDLSTYSEKCGDYCSITCKVGDIGAKTTFNNRTDTQVDLNTTKTIDGATLGMQASWQAIKIPLKHLKFTNRFSTATDRKYTGIKTNANDETAFSMPFHKLPASEFGSTGVGVFQKGTPEAIRSFEKLYIKGDADDFKESFGEGCIYHVEGHISVSVKFLAKPTNGASAQAIVLGLSLSSFYPTAVQVATASATASCGSGDTITAEMDVDADLAAEANLLLWARLNVPPMVTYQMNEVAIEVTMGAGSWLKMTMYDNIADSNVIADMLPVHNALNVIAGAISENALSIKSDWYGGMLSSWNRPSSTGGGHLKAITNGYKIRGLFSDSDNERNMPISFKEMITSLSAMDCIGWGFSKENGVNCVRVERWNWFYKDDIVAELEGTNEATKSVSTSNIKTSLQIGFKKYETASTFNSIDSVHGERTLTNAIKVLSSKLAQLSDLIADTYCIEETRRAKEQVDPTESFKYDENIFVFELGAKGRTAYGSAPEIYVPNNVVASTGVDRPAEQYNIQLSPRRCAERWRSFLFSCSNTTPFRLTSGKINYKASFRCNLPSSTATNYSLYLADFVGGQSLAEDADLAYSKTIFKAERLKFKFPILLDQYKAIIANPYGLISIDGIEGWISEMQYTFATGEADFTLIPKAD